MLIVISLNEKNPQKDWPANVMACNKEKSCVLYLLVQYCKYHYILYCSYYYCPNSIPDVFLSIHGQSWWQDFFGIFGTQYKVSQKKCSFRSRDNLFNENTLFGTPVGMAKTKIHTRLWNLYQLLTILGWEPVINQCNYWATLEKVFWGCCLPWD